MTFSACPKCGHTPLPEDQRLPAACPACGVILSKVAPSSPSAHPPQGLRCVTAPEDRCSPASPSPEPEAHGWKGLLLRTPPDPSPSLVATHALTLLVFAVWGARLVAMDYRDGEIMGSFLHRPLLIFHEAGHLIFRLLGPWVMVLGGTLGQLLMPLIMAVALLRSNRDPFGAAIAMWFFGVSILDVAPYMYDALVPRLMLLSGHTGEEGGHDWIYLFSSMGLLGKARAIGGITHGLGALVIVLALAWGLWLVKTEYMAIRSR